MTTILRFVFKIVLTLFALGVTFGIGTSVVIPFVIGGQDLPSFFGFRIIGTIIFDVFLFWIIIKL